MGTQAGVSDFTTLEAARSEWRTRYLSVLRNELPKAHNAVDRRPLDAEDGPAPPCFFYGKLHDPCVLIDG